MRRSCDVALETAMPASKPAVGGDVSRETSHDEMGMARMIRDGCRRRIVTRTAISARAAAVHARPGHIAVHVLVTATVDPDRGSSGV